MSRVESSECGGARVAVNIRLACLVFVWVYPFNPLLSFSVVFTNLGYIRVRETYIYR